MKNKIISALLGTVVLAGGVVGAVRFWKHRSKQKIDSGGLQ